MGAVLKVVKDTPEFWGNFLEKGNGLESQDSFPGELGPPQAREHGLALGEREPCQPVGRIKQAR